MTRKFVGVALAMMLCLSVSLAYGQRGKEKEKEKPGGGKPTGGSKSEHKSEGNKPPGGEWSQRTHSGKQSGEQPGHENKNSGAAGAAAGHAAEKNNTPKASGAQGAAAGAAAAKNNSPKASGAEGAAAGAAAANRNAPKASGAEGAAAGAAAANRNAPKASGAAGAAAGAAAVNRNSPKVSGAAGAAAGAAVAKNNTPTVSGAEGAAVGAAAAERNTPNVTGAATGYAAVRKSFDQPNMYGQQWYGDHPGAWSAAGWSAGAVWAPVSWDAVAGHCGYGNGTPVTYNYGENVNYQEGNVLVDGESVGTAAEFSQQAADLAERGTDTEVSADEQWLPVGVFALVRNEHQHPQLILQLAINKQGILRGNYTDEVTDHTLPIHGAVDKQTQRAAWTVGGNKQSVMEAGMNNLTESEAPALIHKNGKTDHWLLVRLDQPKGAPK